MWFIICVHGRRGPLIDQEMCKLHTICVNLHIFPPPNHKLYVNVQMQNAKKCVGYAPHFFAFCICTFTYNLWFGRKKCVNLHKLCVIYTFLGRREALVNHRRKSQITFTLFFSSLWSSPLICIYISLSLFFPRCREAVDSALGKKTKTRPMTWNRNVIFIKWDL